MNLTILTIQQLAATATDTTAMAIHRCWVAKCVMPNPTTAASIVFWLFLAWMIGVVVYYWWAIRHYNLNWGLSPQEWKILHPETYCKDQKEIDDFLKRRAALEQRTGQLMAEPPSNPYEKDSFGLPPGTVRGTLALTALVGFVLVQALSMISPNSMDGHFEQLNTVFKMVMAFYFGSRALEVLEKSRKGDATPIVGNTDPAADAAVAGRPATPPAPKVDPPSVPPAKKDLPDDVVEDGPGMPPPTPSKSGTKPA